MRGMRATGHVTKDNEERLMLSVWKILRTYFVSRELG